MVITGEVTMAALVGLAKSHIATQTPRHMTEVIVEAFIMADVIGHHSSLFIQDEMRLRQEMHPRTLHESATNIAIGEYTDENSLTVNHDDGPVLVFADYRQRSR